MMRRLVVPAFSIALFACGGTESTTNPDGPPSADAKTSDAPGPDAASQTFTGTIAVNTLQPLNPANAQAAGNPIGAVTASFAANPTPIAFMSMPQAPLSTPCSAISLAASNVQPSVNEGTVSFSITRNGGGAPAIPSCTFSGGAYDCGTQPTAALIQAGDMVHVTFAPTDSKFTAYNNSVGPVPAIPTLNAATTTLLSSNLDLSGTALTFAITDSVPLPTALVVTIDATDATNFASPLDIVGTNPTKFANLTCAVATTNTMTIPGALLKIVGDIHPTRYRILVLHSASDITLLGTNLNVVASTGLTEIRSTQ